MSFFEKLDLEKKLNIFTGNFFQQSSDLPSRANISTILTNQFKFKNLGEIHDSCSLFEVSQCFVDDVISTRDGLLKKLQGIYEYKKGNQTFLESLVNSNVVASIINTNYDSSFEENANVFKATPFSDLDSPDGRIRLYKVFGDLSDLESCVITKQDFRKLKLLPFYKLFWDSIRCELKVRNSIFLGIDLEDSDFFEFIEFLLEGCSEDVKPMYFVTSKSVLDPKIIEFFNKYKIKLLVSNEYEFFKGLHSFLEGDSKIELEKLFPVENQTVMLEKKSLS
ncbi:SIR2 family protein [Fusobacterium sp. MFO224]|uniref:SIR2 family protein n=1 Tax=Fusobacterium sp. MFO224 TaxID=3378070 RepID=UPI003852B98B